MAENAGSKEIGSPGAAAALVELQRLRALEARLRCAPLESAQESATRAQHAAAAAEALVPCLVPKEFSKGFFLDPAPGQGLALRRSDA